MAVKKTLVNAVPSSLDGKVTRWELTMKYEKGTEGKDDYYTSNKRVIVEASETSPAFGTINNFTPKAEGEWTKKELEDLCPTAKWDNTFDQQYDSVITNPPKEAVTNNDFVLPS